MKTSHNTLDRIKLINRLNLLNRCKCPVCQKEAKETEEILNEKINK